MNVTTESGRLYEIDFELKKFRRTGTADSLDYRTGEPLRMGVWTEFTTMDVNDLGRMIFIEPDDTYAVSTRVVEGLDELITALDK